MIIFREIEIKNYKNVKHAELKDLRDLNIVIGPNNCGKTNLLEFIRSLGNLRLDSSANYLCPECKEVGKDDSDIVCLCLDLGYDDFYLKEQNRTETTVSFLLDEEQINQLVPRVLEKQKEKLKPESCSHIDNSIVMLRPREAWSCFPQHFSIFIHKDRVHYLILTNKTSL